MTKASICVEMIYTEEPVTRRIDYIEELGFSAFEFWTWANKDIGAIEARIESSDLTITNIAGITEQSAPENLTQAMTNPEQQSAAVADIESSISIAQRLDCPFVTVHLGPRQNISYSQMYESVINGLQAITTVAEEVGITILIEPLNWAVNHNGYFLKKSEAAYKIVEDVNSPALGVLFDIYHQQITEGNIISNLRQNIEYIEHIHVADVPGRHEPGTGELNYENILSAINDSKYDGYIGFEFTPMRESQSALNSIADIIQ
jgi:hydroxypyruvate isomerase